MIYEKITINVGGKALLTFSMECSVERIEQVSQNSRGNFTTTATLVEVNGIKVRDAADGIRQLFLRYVSESDFARAVDAAHTLVRERIHFIESDNLAMPVTGKQIRPTQKG